MARSPDAARAPRPDTITFLGVAGARFMVSRQLAASGGIWLDLAGTKMLLDPGPGCIVQTTKRKLDAEKLSAIIVSHRHLDHAADVNVMVEAMTGGGFHRHGRVFAPGDAFGSEPVIHSYLKPFIDGIDVLEPQKSYTVGSVTFTTSVRHVHPVETYGLVFKASGYAVAYIADTAYFDGLHLNYAADVAIVNMVLTEPRPPIEHLSIPEVTRLLSLLKPKLAVLSHFGMHVWQARPWLIAERMTEQTGIRVIAAYDGMKLDPARLEVIKQR